MDTEARGQKRGNGLSVAAGLAIAWGLATGALDSELFWRSSYATFGLHLWYLAVAALLQAGLTLPVCLGAWCIHRLRTRRHPGAHRDAVGMTTVHVVAIMVPIALRMVFWVHRSVLGDEDSVDSPVGILATLAVLIPVLAVCLFLPQPLTRRLAGAADAISRLSRRLAKAGGVAALVVLALVVVGVLQKQTKGTANPDRPSVLLISIDSVRADVWNEYVEQHASATLQRFLASSRRFSNAWATFSGTLPSHGSMFSGLYPREHGAVGSADPEAPNLGARIDPDVELLAERFDAAGYETVGIMSNAWLGPPYGLEAGFQTYVNGGKAGRIGMFSPLLLVNTSLLGYYLNYVDLRSSRHNHPSTRLFRSWLDNRDGSRPFFCFLHYIDVHVPHLPSRRLMKRYCSGPFADLDGWAMKHMIESGDIKPEDMPAALAQIRALNLAVLNHMDNILSPALLAIEEHHLPDNTLIILTSDHGDNLYEKVDDYGHSHVYNVAIRVPLSIRVPGDASGSDWDGMVSVVDFPRTIYRFVGFEPDETLRGIDLLSEVQPSLTDERQIYLLGRDEKNGGYANAICSGRYTLIVNTDGTEELFDWVEDPQQLANLAEAKPELAAQLRVDLERAQAEMRTAESRAFDFDQLPAETLEELSALGYIDP